MKILLLENDLFHKYFLLLLLVFVAVIVVARFVVNVARSAASIDRRPDLHEILSAEILFK